MNTRQAFEPVDLIKALEIPDGDPVSHKALSDALTQCYFLSLESYEGRVLTCRIVVGEPDYGSSYALSENVPLDASKLLPIARAVESSLTALYAAWSQEHDRLAVCKIGTLPDERVHHFPERHPVTIVVAGTGQVGLVFKGRALLYDRGEVKRTNGDSCLLGNHFAWAYKAISDDVIAHMRSYFTKSVDRSQLLQFENRWKECGEEFGRFVEEALPMAIRSHMERLLIGIAQEKCGGAVLIVEDAVKMTTCVKSMISLTPCESAFAGLPRPFVDGMRTYLSIVAQMKLGSQGKTILPHLDSPRLKAWVEHSDANEASALARWDEDIDRTVALARVDGALILGAQLDPVGFCAKFKIDNPKAFTLETSEYLKSKGTRHLSMACAVQQSGRSVGFVISQDGPITLFVNDGESGVQPLEVVL